jgi:hypothetical protein
MNENNTGKLPADEHRPSELRIPVTKLERAQLDRAAAGGHTATWARLVLLAAAKKSAKQ